MIHKNEAWGRTWRSTGWLHTPNAGGPGETLVRELDPTAKKSHAATEGPHLKDPTRRS